MRVIDKGWQRYVVVDNNGDMIDAVPFGYHGDACQHMGKLIADAALGEVAVDKKWTCPECSHTQSAYELCCDKCGW